MPKCSGFTSQGIPCDWRTLGDTAFCKRHQGQADLPEAVLAAKRDAYARMSRAVDALRGLVPEGHLELFAVGLTAAVMTKPELVSQLGANNALSTADEQTLIRELADFLRPELAAFSRALQPPGNEETPVPTDPGYLAGPALAESIPNDLPLRLTAHLARIMEEIIERGRQLRLPVVGEESGFATLAENTPADWSLERALLAQWVFAYIADVVLQGDYRAGIAGGHLAPVVLLDVEELLQRLERAHRGQEARRAEKRWIRRELIAISQVWAKARHFERRLPGGRKRRSVQEEALFTVDDRQTRWEGGQIPRDPDAGTPEALRIVGGAMFARIARNQRELRRLGCLSTLSRFRLGRPWGQWGAAISLAYVHTAAQRPLGPITTSRRALITRFMPTPDVEEVLRGKHPDAMLKYWAQAKAELVQEHWWEPFEEPAFPSCRYGKWEAWLDQAVTITPGRTLRDTSVPALPSRSISETPALHK